MRNINSINQFNTTMSIFINCRSWVYILLIIFSFQIESKTQDIPVNPNCLLCQEIQTYPQLASLNSEDGKLTQLLLGQLLGTEINLTALNWQGVVQGNVSALELLRTLKTQLNLSSPTEVLNTELQFIEIINALIIVAENDGTVALLNQISAGVEPGSILLSDLMTINTVNGDLVDMNFNVLTLITGMVQLYNYSNVLVTNDPIVLDLGVLGSLTLRAQVVEPPHFGCSSSGAKFFSAGIRMKLDIDIIDEIILDLEVPIAPFTASVEASIENISLYVDVAKGEVTLNSINSNTQQFNIDVEPGLARVFVSHIDVDDFFDRTQDPIDFLEPSQLGNINVNVLGLISDILALNVETNGKAQNEMVNTTNIVPFSDEVGSSSTAISNLLSDLLSNSEVTISSDAPIVGLLLNIVYLIENDITDVSNLFLFEANSGKVFELLENVVDPLLNSAGIGIGEVLLHSDRINENCYDFGDAPDSYQTTLESNGARSLITDDAIHLGMNGPSPSTNGTPSELANFDTNDDGLVTTSETIINGQYQVEVNYSNMSSDSAMIVGWLDFNLDGSFDNDYERSFISPKFNVEPLSTGNIVLNWYNLPNDSEVIDNFLRLRISTDPQLKDLASAVSDGIFVGGEVEDHFLAQIALDLDLITFHAQAKDSHNLLSWQSQSEVNFSGFEVQKSLDGKDFRNIGWVSGKSKNGERASYKFTDAQSSAKETMYYRLKMVDLDNSFNYSKMISINNNNHSIENEILIYPNPADQVVNIESYSNIRKLKIFDLAGILVKDIDFHDTNIVSFAADNMPNGMYLLRVIDENGHVENRRLTVR